MFVEITTSITRDSEFDVFELDTIETLPLTVKEIQNEISKDTALVKLVNKLQRGLQPSRSESFNIDITEFVLQQGILMRSHRVVIPSTLRERVLKELHLGHFGIVKTKKLARSYCWWPNTDADIEKLIKNCSHCLQTKNNPIKVDTHIWEPAAAPFDRVHFDFAGPIQNKYFAILIDGYSKFPIVKILNNITSKTTIHFCREVFATFGIPRVFVSDNGTQLCSQEFQNFLRSNGITHKRTAPFHPATNGQAERFVQIFKKSILRFEGNDLEINLRRQFSGYCYITELHHIAQLN